MNDLEKFIRNNQDGRMIDKWLPYLEIYDRHFSRFRGQAVNVLEIGVQNGGSLRMWRDYFGEKARIFGADIDPRCEALEEEGVRIFIGDQSDRAFLRRMADDIGQIDILIDDGGHEMRQQIPTFEELFPRISEHGVFLCEDLHWAYKLRLTGGYRPSFTEYSKRLINKMHGYRGPRAGREHWWKRRVPISDFTKTAYSICYYESVIVIEKRPMGRPRRIVVGEEALGDD